MMVDGMKTKTVFGKEIDITEFAGLDAREVMAPVDQLQLEDADPAFVYGWLNTAEADTKYKLQKGLWEEVNAKTDPVKVPGMTGTDGDGIRVRELMLVKMPREKYEALQRAYAAKSVLRQVRMEQGFQSDVGAIASKVSPGADANATVTKREKIVVTK